MGRTSRRKWEGEIKKLEAALANSSRNTIPSYLRAIGIVGLFSGAGLALVNVFFWLGVTITYVGLALLALDIWVQNWAVKRRCLVSIIPAALFVLLSMWIAPSDLSITILPHPGDFKEGELIGQIPWKSEWYSELRVTIANPTNSDYDELHGKITNDLGTAKWSLVSSPPGCFLREDVTAPIEVRASGKDKSGRPSERLAEKLFTTYPIHLYCDKLRGGDSVQAVFALLPGVLQLGKADISKPESLFGPKKLPSWAAIEGEYKVHLRPHRFSKQEEFFKQ